MKTFTSEHCKHISEAKKGVPNLKRRTPLIELVCLNCGKKLFVK